LACPSTYFTPCRGFVFRAHPSRRGENLPLLRRSHGVTRRPIGEDVSTQHSANDERNGTRLPAESLRRPSLATRVPDGATRVWRRDAAAPTAPAFTPARSGQPPLAPVSRGRNGGDVGRPSPVAPFIAEARAVDARFHARITLPPVSSSRDPLEQLEGYSRGMTHASCRGRRVTNSRSSSIQRCPRASPIDRASPQPRLGRPEGRSNPGVLACATTPAARRGDAERETTIHMARHVNRYLVAGGIELSPSASRFLAYHSDSRVAPRRATGPLW